jgi:iron complex outermembrane recepter protein
VRSPTPFDVDVEERFGPVSLSGNPTFRTEKLTAFELGTRVQPARGLSFSLALFYHRYDDLRTVEIVPGPGLSLSWGNGLKGNLYGFEAWADWRPTSWWTLAGGVTVLKRDFRFKAGATGILGTAQLGTDPPYYATLRSAMKLGPRVALDLDFRAVGALRDSAVPSYQELGGRLAWQVTPQITLLVTGSNLLHEHHQEYPGGDLIPRRVMAGVELRY